MDHGIKLDGNRLKEASRSPQFDLERLKWIDPCDDEKFLRKEPGIREGASNEALLQNILRLTDQIFDHLSVFEQCSEASSRGAIVDPERKVGLPGTTTALVKAERELWGVYQELKKHRQTFVERQLELMGLDERSKELKLHIGSADHLLEHWINLDAGGADVSLNVNWGLPFSDGSVSFVYAAHVLEHLRGNDQAPVLVREIHRVLARGGVARFVVPDLRKLLLAYAQEDREFFAARHRVYPLSEGFMNQGVVDLDYILLFSGAGPQLLNYNHKFGYDSVTLCKLLGGAGFRAVKACRFQGSAYAELRVDEHSYNTRAGYGDDQHFSLFVEAQK
jgi:SAM-dependent methyltransferase